MLRQYVIALIVLCGVTSVSAQEPVPNSGAAAKIDLQQVAPGDHWTYEVKDEIVGTILRTRTDMVTDVSKNEIAVRFDVADTGRSGNLIYDRSWNILREEPFKYSPNNGTGIQLPLTLGAQWKFAIDVTNSRNGLTFRRIGNSKVTAKESITTKAGTFETFVIETNYAGKNIQDPTLINESSDRTWFSLDVNHWVKRNIVRRQRGHVTENNTIELIDYGHKKQ
jgi:hypothetical protein